MSGGRVKQSRHARQQIKHVIAVYTNEYGAGTMIDERVIADDTRRPLAFVRGILRTMPNLVQTSPGIWTRKDDA